MVAWAQREAGRVYPAWWEDKQKLLARRLREMNYAQMLTEESGLPDGMMVTKGSWAFQVYVDGNDVYRLQFATDVKTAAEKLAAWIEAYRQEKESEDIMGISPKGLDLLKELVKGGIERKALGYRALVADALKKKGLVSELNGWVMITSDGIGELHGLPEFDKPIASPPGIASPPTQEPTSPPAPLRKEERGEDSGVGRLTIEIETDADTPAAVVQERVDGAEELSKAIKRAVNAGESIPEKPVTITFGDGFELADFVEHCGAQIETMGGISIKLTLKTSLLRRFIHR